MLESISLDIANYWASNDFLTESNKNCGNLVAFDWRKDYLTEINTNIDLSYLEVENFEFDIFVEFLKKNNFTFILGLRNVEFEYNPSPEWTDKLKETLKFNGIEYDEYIIGRYPTPIPQFDIPENVFILRYSFDPNNKIDNFASTPSLFKDFMENSWKRYYKDTYWMKDILSKDKTRVIVLCSDIENLILKEGFDK
tara:strand:- start:957 stop:1544 length:588 start_codon:yes stop_codon:yes gene_type:complete